MRRVRRVRRVRMLDESEKGEEGMRDGPALAFASGHDGPSHRIAGGLLR